jgi:small subunit ribosomal protein S17
MTASQRTPRKTVVGTVVSHKMQKTITVREDRMVQHAKYGKYLRRHITYKAHDEEGKAKEGDVVEIALTRPLSKSKHWTLVQIVQKGRIVAVSGEEDREKAAPPPKRRPEPAKAEQAAPESSEESAS